MPQLIHLWRLVFTVVDTCACLPRHLGDAECLTDCTTFCTTVAYLEVIFENLLSRKQFHWDTAPYRPLLRRKLRKQCAWMLRD